MKRFKPIRGMKIKVNGKKATVLYINNDEEFLVGFDEPFDGHDGNLSRTEYLIPDRYADNNRCWWVGKEYVHEILTNKLEVL